MPDEWLITEADLIRAIRNLHQITVIPRGEAAVRGEAFDAPVLARDILRQIDKAADGGEQDRGGEPATFAACDPEVYAISGIAELLDTLPAAARPRVLRWACARHGVETVY